MINQDLNVTLPPRLSCVIAISLVMTTYIGGLFSRDRGKVVVIQHYLPIHMSLRTRWFLFLKFVIKH